MTRFVDVPALSRLVQGLGAERFIAELAETIREEVDLVPPAEDPKDPFRFACGGRARASLRRAA